MVLKLAGMNLAKFYSMEWHWAASSLVGCRIKYRSLLISTLTVIFSLRYFWRMGRRYAAVLPLPVTE